MKPKRRKILSHSVHIGGKYSKPGIHVYLSCGHDHFIVKYDYWKVFKTTNCPECTNPKPKHIQEIEKEARKAARRDIRRYEDWIRCQIEGKARLG
jgi:hypothetical protein